jgi:hypothetical protein
MRLTLALLLVCGCDGEASKSEDLAVPSPDLSAAGDLAVPDFAAQSINRYGASAARGDFAVWTIMSGNFTVEWTATDGGGGAAAVWQLAGTCTAPDATFGHRVCTVATAALSSGGADGSANGGPAVGDEYYVLELPGVAIAAHPKGTLADLRHELHVGLAVGSCTNPGGTFTFNGVRAGVPGNIDQLLGRSAITVDAQGVVSSVDGWDYGLLVNGASSTNSGSDPIRPLLLTPASVPHPLSLTGATCDSGIVHVPILGATLRGVISSSGVVLLDLPHKPGVVNGSGGLVAVTAGASASLTDLVGKPYSGVMFTEGGKVDLFSATVAADGTLTVTTTLNQTVADNTGFGKITALSDPALATFSVGMVDFTNLTSGTYGTNALYGAPSGDRTSAPAPAALGGVFVTTDGSGHFFEATGRAMVGITHKAPNGHVMIAGSHVAVSNPTLGTSRCFAGTALAGNQQQYCVDGEFVAFSR